MPSQQEDILISWIQSYFQHEETQNLANILKEDLCGKFLESNNRLLFVYLSEEPRPKLAISPKFTPNSLLFHSPLSYEKAPLSVPPIDDHTVTQSVQPISNDHLKNILSTLPKLDNAKLQNLISDIQIELDGEQQHNQNAAQLQSAGASEAARDSAGSHSLEGSFQNILNTLTILQLRDYLLNLDEEHLSRLEQSTSSNNDAHQSPLERLTDAFILRELRDANVWQMDFHEMRNKYEAAIDVLHFIQRRTSQRSTTSSAQTGETQRLLTRLQQILQIRTEVAQIKYYAAHNRSLGDVESVLKHHLETVEPLHISEYTQQLWDDTMHHVRAEMKQIESSMLNDLRTQLSRYSFTDHSKPSSVSRPEMLLNEFLKHQMVVLSLAKELVPERKILAQQMITYIHSLKSKFDEFQFELQQQNGKLQSNPLLSFTSKYWHNLTSSVVRAVQLKQKTLQLEKSTVLFLNVQNDSENDWATQTDALSSACRDFVSELEQFASKQFIQWQQNVENLNRRSSLSTDASNFDPEEASLLLYENVQIEEADEDEKETSLYNRKLSASYNSLLIDFANQCKILKRLLPALKAPVQSANMSFNQTLHQLAQQAEDYHAHSLLINQVVNFYNRALVQILPCQRLMMHSSQANIYHLISNHHHQQKHIWNKKFSTKFLNQFKTSVEKFASENRKLRKYHLLIGNHVIQLMSINLLTEKERWIAKIIELRNLFQRLEGQYSITTTASVDSTSPTASASRNPLREWKIHWDHQLFKAFEHQYRLGLQTLNEYSLSEMQVELLFKEKRVQYQPSLEKIRELYFRKLRDFLAFPQKFRGIGGGAASIYNEMISRNHSSLQIVYRKGHQLFAKLEKLQKGFQSLVVLGTVSGSLDQIIDHELNNLEDFYANFVKIKEKRHQLEKIDNVIVKDCIAVSTKKVKQSVEDQLQRFEELLIDSLRTKANRHLKTIDDFIDESLEVLGQDSQSMQEIGDSYSYCKKIIEEKREIFDEFHQFELKSAMLKKIVGVGLSAARTRDKWNEFMETLKAQSKNLNERRVNLRDDVSNRISQFRTEVAKYDSRWTDQIQKQITDSMLEDPSFAQQELSFITEREEELLDFQERAQELVKEANCFELNMSEFAELKKWEDRLDKYATLWKPFEEFQRDLDELKREEWVMFKRKLDVFEDFIGAQRSKIVSQGGERTVVMNRVLHLLDIYEQFLTPLKFLNGEGWTLEHWVQLFKMLNIEPQELHNSSTGEEPKEEDEAKIAATGNAVAPNSIPLEKLQFGHLLDHAPLAIRHLNDIKLLNSRAMAEEVIRKALQELRVWESSAEFSVLVNEINKIQTPLIKEWKDIMSQVGENQSLLGSLRDHQYAHLFQDEIYGWDMKLTNLDLYLRKLNEIQRKWIYLAPIFFRGALPSEQARFNRLDSSFRSIMVDIQSDPRLLQFAKRNLKDTLETILEQLLICQQALNEFLESKRERFPRFYFIGDDDLLEILGQAKKPAIIQNHLKKLFAGIHSVKFGERDDTIIAMCSSQGELVPLNNEVHISEKVEEWLLVLDEEMRTTLKALLSTILAENADDLLQSLQKYPSQILCLSENIRFTFQCEQHIQRGSVGQFHAQLKSKLRDYTQFNSRNTNDHATAFVNELKLKSLILDLIHNIDVVEQLMEGKVSQLSNWGWQKQLRFYFETKEGTSSKDCFIRMCDAEFHYTYEYQGNAPKLVHTPLTDKCYLTLTQGMHLGFGGNPYGPAGTGKTESVKALGSSLGRLTLVQNCDEGIDFKSMGRIFIGLVKCGAWGCFDEFNRLKEDQLSAVSQQIQLIQHAIKSGSQSDSSEPLPIELNGKQVIVNPNAGIFVTLNPAGKKYGGRSKLPDNLKQLFRSVAMSKPDVELIAEVILFSEGFEHAKYLSKKLVSTFQLCKQLLSAQQHYDWGLRALKTILGVGGNLIKQMKRENQGTSSSIQDLEAQIIIKALRVNTISKLTHHDLQLFNGIISDVFPGISAPEISYGEMEQAIRDVLTERNLQVVPAQIQKILQFYEALNQRMGVVTVGPSGSGKSICWRICFEALKKLGRDMKVYVCNPKSISRQQLLGNMDPDTREWSDGILTGNARKVVQEPLSTYSWIVCDGDIDPKWIESLNSVLDDNRLLTMPTGERIQFGDNVNFVFETHSLKYASPATVSRMGMIFLSEKDVNMQSIIGRWLHDFQTQYPNNAYIDLIRSLIDQYFEEALNILERDFSSGFVVGTTKIGLILSGLSAHTKEVTTKSEFVLALIRTFGSYLNVEDRTQYAKQLFQLCNEKPVDLRKPLDSFYSRQTSQFAPYSSGSSNSSNRLQYDDLWNYPMIPTVDVQRARDIVMPWLRHKEPFILIGPEGAGKKMLLNNCFKNLKNTQVVSVHCNAQTQASNVIQKLMQFCGIYTSGQSKVLRPRESENLVLYLRDINLPKPDEYGTTQLVSFLQQILTYNGFYDDEMDIVQLEKIQIVASMNPSSSVGRYPLSTRLTSIVRICYISYPETEQLLSIYTEFTRVVFEHRFASHSIWNVPANMKLIANAMISLYKQIIKNFTIDDYAHYVFTPRDLTQWITGLLNYDITNQKNDSSELLDIWTYEARKIFRDRIVQDKAYQNIESNVLQQFADLNYQCRLDEDKVLYASIVQPANAENTTNRLLCKTDMKELALKIREGMKVFERENRKLRILLIPETVDYIARIDRVISRNGGSLLLVGRPGTGRSNMLSLMCHMHKIELFTPKMVLNSSFKQFKQDFKYLFQVAALEDKPICFFLEDHQNVDSAFFEHMNSVLSSGEFPGLYTREEFDALMVQLKDKASQTAFEGTTYEFLTAQITKNLRIALSMDPTSHLFNIQCQSNPAIFNRCAIQWKTSFSSTGSLKIPKLILKEIFTKFMKDSSIDPVEIIKTMVRIHLSMNDFGATPALYLRFLDTFKSLYLGKLTEKKNEHQRYTTGLKKLREAATEVDRLSTEAQETKKLLAEKRSQTKQALAEIDVSMKESAQESSDIRKLKEKIASEEVKIREKEVVIHDQLKDIQPLIDSAKEAVGSLSTKSLGYIRSLPMPPNAIRDVLSGVLRLMGNNDTSWKGMKKFLGGRGVVNEIMTLDPRTISKSVIDSVKEHINEKPDSFEESNIQRVNKEAAVLAKWVVATVRYSEVLKQVGPLESDAKSLKKSGIQLKQQLNSCETKMTSLTAKIKQLQDELQVKTREAATLGNQLEKAENTLSSAQQLLSKLADEKKRWEKQDKEVGGQLKQLPALSLLASAFITYLPGFPEDFRAEKLSVWMKLLRTESFDFSSFMSSESQLLIYKGEGLPSDQLSQENAIVILESIQYPLVIDPSQQATQWLKQHMSSKNIEVTTSSDPKFASHLELAIRFGKVLIVEEVDRIEPILFPLLRKELIVQGPRKSVLIGDKIVDFNEEFQMYLVTRNPHVVLSPDSASLVSQINFTVTRSGLEGQLLGITINHENPGLEQQKSEELRKEEQNKIKLADLEKQLLDKLSSTDNLLQDTSLIASLDKIKSSSQEIKENLEKSQQVKADIETSRNAYRPFAKDGSTLFFLIRDLPKLNRMYQFSLGSFLKLFRSALEGTPSSNDLAQRIDQLAKHLRTLAFNFCSRSLFKNDRLLFAMHMCKGLYPETIDEDRWNYFIGNMMNAETKSIIFSPPKWAPAERISAYEKFASALPDFVQEIKLDENPEFQNWLGENVVIHNVPSSIRERVSAFDQLMLVQLFRPSHLVALMNHYVQNLLGIESVTPPPIGLQDIYEHDSTKDEPILLVTTPGSDPSLELEQMANNHPDVGRERFHQIAMGQGQTDEALLMLRRCGKKGEWLCLKNLHLVVAWLPRLEKELSMLTERHNNFRLWLTTEVHDEFPIILLRESVKFTFEAPPGMKQNMMRTYSSWSQKFINSPPPALAAGEASPMTRSQLLFVAAFFHAIVQERRTYIPQGWTKSYEFSTADLRSSVDIIEACFSRVQGNSGPDWETIHGLFENAIYGGRIDDFYDLRILRTYLEKYFTSDAIQTKTKPTTHLSVGLDLPESTDKSDFEQLIHQFFHDIDSPQLFGLPPNATAFVQISRGQEIVSGLKSLTLVMADSGSLTFNKEEWGELLTPIIQFWKSLSSKHYDVLFNTKLSGPSSSNDPLVSFVSLEFSNALELVRFVDKAFNDTQEVIKGTMLLTSSIQQTAAQLIKGEVPLKWEDKWEGPQNIQVWLKGVVDKTVALSKFVNVSSSALLQSDVNLDHFFNANVFLNALKQKTARESSIPLDKLDYLISSWSMGSLRSYSAVTVRLRGISLQGAQFSNNRLQHAKESSPSLSQMPEFEVAWCTKEDYDKFISATSQTKILSAPLYYTPARERFLSALTVPCDDQNAFILTGTCFFVSAEL
uniref:Cytoplasmic dynein 2 heavy chain 1 n=1 Tax=Percolomonas cosmopolitus TaxID=63605 RepID=A0A7S1KLM8_9EUKA|mmetsp:Transcript_11107/g.41478  ORF Transcript_11107/g.41478 Transcript_11107/m.41478 type:complete len:4358 (+) Transcript_11107:185-13258(+)|eukprot:CAMPEP_0117440944 /NCGR_PEP_ID=MMETSP0759-20121206/3361_1 /TAXON_ID=63605 /ORGANISM="Percolomonas cosmopolitus, Strain WS" /LENGTH=4357 /DNA_ID=CAMNT_0005232745 /DNA_START=124 /DNA_END=13197 /DNA_ORIENTATION=-